jgi:hypothetical protein
MKNFFFQRVITKDVNNLVCKVCQDCKESKIILNVRDYLNSFNFS